MKTILLSDGSKTIVDDADADLFGRCKWCLQTVRRLQYARRWDGRKTIYLHREIMQPQSDMVIDHIDGDGLNNQRINLRIVTRRQNQWNRQNRAEGIYWTDRLSKWRANIGHNGRTHEIGFYDQLEDAIVARAYVASVLRQGIAPEAVAVDQLALRPAIRRLIFTSQTTKPG